MSGACRNVALTCAYAVFDGDTTNCPTGTSGQTTCIQKISEMFYQSLLCPDNSVYQKTASSTFGNGTSYVNAHCMCASGYKAQGSACVANGTAGSGGSASSNTSISCGPSTIKVYDTVRNAQICASADTYNPGVFDVLQDIQSQSMVTVSTDDAYYTIITDATMSEDVRDQICKEGSINKIKYNCAYLQESTNSCRCNKSLKQDKQKIKSVFLLSTKKLTQVLVLKIPQTGDFFSSFLGT